MELNEAREYYKENKQSLDTIFNNLKAGRVAYDVFNVTTCNDVEKKLSDLINFMFACNNLNKLSRDSYPDNLIYVKLALKEDCRLGYILFSRTKYFNGFSGAYSATYDVNRDNVENDVKAFIEIIKNNNIELYNNTLTESCEKLNIDVENNDGVSDESSEENIDELSDNKPESGVDLPGKYSLINHNIVVVPSDENIESIILNNNLSSGTLIFTAIAGIQKVYLIVESGDAILIDDKLSKTGDDIIDMLIDYSSMKSTNEKLKSGLEKQKLKVSKQAAQIKKLKEQISRLSGDTNDNSN